MYILKNKTLWPSEDVYCCCRRYYFCLTKMTQLRSEIFIILPALFALFNLNILNKSGERYFFLFCNATHLKLDVLTYKNSHSGLGIFGKSDWTWLKNFIFLFFSYFIWLSNRRTRLGNLSHQKSIIKVCGKFKKCFFVFPRLRRHNPSLFHLLHQPISCETFHFEYTYRFSASFLINN